MSYGSVNKYDAMVTASVCIAMAICIVTLFSTFMFFRTHTYKENLEELKVCYKHPQHCKKIRTERRECI